MSSKKFYSPQGSGTVGVMLIESGFTETTNIKEADFLVLTGGADISPELYGELNVRSSCNKQRDSVEIEAVREALELGIYLVGICRGAQLLNIVSGGSMWQDVNNHSRSHPMLDLLTGDTIETTSIHHQMMIPIGNYKLLAYSHISDTFINDKGTFKTTVHKDPEVVYYNDTKALCVQGHPEFAEKGSKYRDYFLKMLHKMLRGEL